ncbi:MAG: OmpA family protein [Hyphomicrobium sp.]|jgi:outer membrane protein OmpA-like peptidoglycan-associated protein
MRGTITGSIIGLLVAATAVAPGVAAADGQGSVRDLVFTVIDLGGKVQDLQIKQTETEVHIELAADVLFDFDKDTLKPAAQETLQKAATVIREQTKGDVRIDGHTDAKGDDNYNQKLSERRAAAVKNWLLGNGNLAGRRMGTHGFGEQKPVVSNTLPDGSDDPDGRQKNRRVEITVKK